MLMYQRWGVKKRVNRDDTEVFVFGNLLPEEAIW